MCWDCPSADAGPCTWLCWTSWSSHQPHLSGLPRSLAVGCDRPQLWHCKLTSTPHNRDQERPLVQINSCQQLSGSTGRLNTSLSYTRRGGINHYPLYMWDGSKNLGRENWTLTYHIGCDEIQESISLTHTTALTLYPPTEPCSTVLFHRGTLSSLSEWIPVLEACRKCISLLLTQKPSAQHSSTQEGGTSEPWTCSQCSSWLHLVLRTQHCFYGIPGCFPKYIHAVLEEREWN